MKAKNNKLSDDAIIEMYMNYVLEYEMVPQSIYKFCKVNTIEESNFYQYFGSVESIQKAIWNKFFDHTVSLIHKNKKYSSFSNKDKMLTFFYSFFELLTINRSYVLFALQNKNTVFQNITQLKGIRKQIKDFAVDLIEVGKDTKCAKISTCNSKLFSEAAWVQFIFVLKFWYDDDSAAFEKTDIAIEKSITTAFDVFENTPLDNIVDFGKFLFKEKMS